MKLIDIVKSLPWPDGAVIVVQCEQGVLSYYFGNQFIKRVEAFEIADDYDEGLVTRGEWIAAQEQVAPKEREPGFYWVLGTADWFVAEWNGEIWSAPFNDNQFDDAGVFQIDERRIVRQP